MMTRYLSSRHMLFAYLFTVVLVVFVFSYFANSLALSVMMAIILGLLIWVSKPIWYPADHGKTRVALLSLTIAASAFFSYGLWGSIWQSIRITVFGTTLAVSDTSTDYSRTVVFVILALVIWVVNYFMRDTTAMGVHAKPIAEDIPDRSFPERFASVCGALGDDLTLLDNSLRWSYRNFVPLTAVVELRTRTGSKKKTTDLLRAIRSSKERLFLLLGDPGSGKSVSLRQLCRDLLSEAVETGKIPIYVNLREWHSSDPWSEDNPPTPQQLYDFVYHTLTDEKDIITGSFFKEYFSRLYEAGRLYFLLDSFDEIPDVLDERDNSEKIRVLSEVMFRFLKGARADQSQGILASRYFRKPTSEFNANVTLEIMPFDEDRIIKVMKRSPHFTDNVVTELFTQRTDLVPTARNPFMAGLIVDYLENHDNALPANEFDLYSSFVGRVLRDCSERIEKAGLAEDQVRSCAVQIATIMFEVTGLEAPVVVLSQKCVGQPIERVVDILSDARLGRLGGQGGKRFSFAHRRFAEYFAVTRLLDDPGAVELRSIPTDSRWRDALVLYCEVASDAQAEKVALYCWEVIKANPDPRNLETIHCLRFLRDAFRSRGSCLDSFRDEFAAYLSAQIQPENSMLSVKLAVECLGLTNIETVDSCVVKALQLNNSWISETAVKSCRHLPRISGDLKARLLAYINSIPMAEFIRRRKAIGFSLRLSDAFRSVRAFYQLRVYDSIVWPIGIFIAAMIVPYVTLNAVLSCFLMRGLNLCVRSPKPFPNIILMIRAMTIGMMMAIPTTIGFLLVTLTSPSWLWRELLSAALIDIPDTFAVALLIVAAVLLIPLPSIGLLKLRWRKIIRSAVILLLLFSSMSVLDFLAHEYEHFYIVVTFILAATTGLGLAGIIGWVMYREIVAWRAYQGIRLTHSGYNRESIYSTVKLLLPHGQRYLLRYVRDLEQNARSVSGEWPDTDILKASDNEALTRLARLEEKWLGLDR